MPGKVILKVTNGPMRGKVFTFDEHDTFIFGRARDCHARLSQDDTTASRHHFMLEVNPPDVRVRDLGSLNGTYINGKKYGGRREGETPEAAALRKLPEVDLKNRDKIGVGETVFSVTIQLPTLCCRCRKEIPDEFTAMCKWIEETYICPSCRKQVEDAGNTQHAPEPERCDQCGKDVSAEIGSGRQGDYICEICRTQAKFDPVSVLIKLLMHQRDEGKEEASLSNIAGYEIKRMLGRGTMGAVYLAHRKEDGASVALKILLSKVAVDERSRESFHREIETTRELESTNIVALLEHGSAGSGFYFATEYCAGGNVAELLQQRGGRLSLDEAGAILLQGLRGLSFAHERGFVHRNLKPQNLLLSSLRPLIAKISDFGFARSFERAGFSGMSATTGSSATPMFVPREQLVHFRYSNPVSDVWSMAAIFYYLLTGQPPREIPPGKDPVEVILRGGFVPLLDRDSGVSRKLAKLIDRALSDDPADRYRDATEFLKALKRQL